MPRYDLEYPKETFSTVKRKSDRANYALKTIHRIVNSSKLLHVSFTVPSSPFPMILPMIGQMGSFSRPSADEADVLELYLHGYVSSRLMGLSRNSSVGNGSGYGGEGGNQQQKPAGLPVSVAASHVDGVVLALTPNSHSYNYRSAVLFGRAEVVADNAEKLYAMELITDSVLRGAWRHSRVPPNAAEMQSTTVLRVRIETGSAKIRSGEPHDEKYDLQADGLTERVWTGVLPVYQTIGEPIPGPYCRPQETPAYIAEYRRDFNDAAVETALAAAVEPQQEK